MLTPNFSEGVNAGYVYDGVVGSVFVAPPGYQPLNLGLKPVHKWRVNQSGRVYYYYSNYYRNLGSGYTYQGVLGHMYEALIHQVTVSTTGGPVVTVPVYKVKSCYSQTYGYWHGILTPINLNTNPPIYSLETPPTGTYNCGPEHELIGGGLMVPRGSNPNATVVVPEGSLWAETKDDPAGTPQEEFHP